MKLGNSQDQNSNALQPSSRLTDSEIELLRQDAHQALKDMDAEDATPRRTNSR